MELTCNQKIVLLIFIVAIVSIVFMEYTREQLLNVDVSQITGAAKDFAIKVNNVVEAAQAPPAKQAPQ